jgi:hypothetical protein
MSNSRSALFCAAIVLIIPLMITDHIEMLIALVRFWMALPFLIFSFLVRTLTNRAYLLLCLGALGVSIYLSILVGAGRLGARGGVALMVVPFYQLFALNIAPLIHIAWRIVAASPNQIHRSQDSNP